MKKGNKILHINLAQIYSEDKSKMENDMYDKILVYEPSNIKINRKREKKITKINNFSVIIVKNTVME